MKPYSEQKSDINKIVLAPSIAYMATRVPEFIANRKALGKGVSDESHIIARRIIHDSGVKYGATKFNTREALYGGGGLFEPGKITPTKPATILADEVPELKPTSKNNKFYLISKKSKMSSKEIARFGREVHMAKNYNAQGAIGKLLHKTKALSGFAAGISPYLILKANSNEDAKKMAIGVSALPISNLANEISATTKGLKESAKLHSGSWKKALFSQKAGGIRSALSTILGAALIAATPGSAYLLRKKSTSEEA